MIALPAGHETYAVLGFRELVIANTVNDNRGSITPKDTCKPHLPCFLVAVSGSSTNTKQTCVARTPINPSHGEHDYCSPAEDGQQQEVTE